MSEMKKIGVLFVCMGNICRSPSAEGVFRKLVQEHALDQHIDIDSAGTHAYHIGEPPDQRSQAAARQRNIDLSGIRGRQFSRDDFHRFDYVLAMDKSNLSDIRALHQGDGKAEIALFLEYARQYPDTEVPDPYYGGARGFEQVLDLIEDASTGLLEHIKRRHL